MSSASAEQTSQHVLRLTQALLDAIAANDYAIYQTLCDTSLTAFEPEAEGNLVEGLDFHKFYFNAASKSSSAASDVQNTIVAPRVRLLGQTGAVITYVRLTQRYGYLRLTCCTVVCHSLITHHVTHSLMTPASMPPPRRAPPPRPKRRVCGRSAAPSGSKCICTGRWCQNYD